MIGSKIVDSKIKSVWAWYSNFINRRDRVMLDDLKSRDLMHPQFKLARLIGYLGAGLVHSFTILVPIFGLWVIQSRFAGNFSTCYGLLLFGVAYVIRPRRSAVPEESLSRAKYPALYEFVDDISKVLNTPLVDAIVVDQENNAYMGLYGWRNAKILTIGYPLWRTLDEQSRIALIGHELAHLINKDVTRSIFVGTALNSLIHWYHLLYPDSVFDRRAGIFALPFKVFFWFISNCVQAMYIGLYQILLYDKRRAEYLADYIGASAGGTQAMINSLKLLKARNPNRTLNDITTHPSTELRIEFLESKPQLPAKVVFATEYHQRVDNEMLTFQPTPIGKLRWK